MPGTEHATPPRDDWTARLQTFTAGLLVASSQEDIARIVVRDIPAMVGARAAAIYLREGETLRLTASEGYGSAASARWQTIELSERLPLSIAVRENQPLWFGTAADVAAFPDVKAVVDAAGDHGLAALPLVVAGVPLGVLGISFARPLGFDEPLRHRLLTVASLTAQALDRSRLLRAEREAKRFQQRLIGIVGHDLRTPLSVVTLAASLLEHNVTDPAQLSSVARIRRAAERMDRIVRDLIDYTQVTAAGGIAVQFSAVDLHDICMQTLSAAERAGRPIVYERGEDGTALLDRQRLEQVLENLVNNALKYGAPGTPITVRWFVEGDCLVLEVHNQGPAIPAALQEEIFHAFRRGTHEPGPGRDSLGLGLYIVRQIVNAHRGTVSVRSSETQGTTFRVSLPRDLTSPERAAC